MKCFNFFRDGNKSEGGESGAPKNQNHSNDHSPPTQEEPPQQVDPPDASETNKDESETEQEGVKCQLSSSVIIDMPNIQSSLELSTITGATKTAAFMLCLRISDQNKKR